MRHILRLQTYQFQKHDEDFYRGLSHSLPRSPPRPVTPVQTWEVLQRGNRVIRVLLLSANLPHLPEQD